MVSATRGECSSKGVSGKKMGRGDSEVCVKKMGNFLVDFSKIMQVQCDHVVSTFQILKGLKNIQHC